MMRHIDEKIDSIRAIQSELSHRTKVEHEAARLMTAGRHREAMELLAGLEAETPAAGTAGESK